MRRLFEQVMVYKDDGGKVLSGSGAPSVAIGVEGDYYIDTVLNRLYGPKVSGSWGLGILL